MIGTATPHQIAPVATRLTVALAVVAGAGALATAVDPDLLAGEPVMVGNLRGTAWAVLLVGVPTLLISMWRGTRRAAPHVGDDAVVALVVWFGTVAYLVYQGVMFCFATPMNALFLLYVGTLGLALWTLISLWPAMSAAGAARTASDGPTRVRYRLIAVVVGGAAALNALAWLARVVPVMQTGELPDAVRDSGLTTNPVLVQDLAFWLPAAIVISIATWKRHQTGLLLAGAFLTFWVLEGLTVASDQFWGARADDSLPELASLAMVPAALFVSGILAVPLIMLFRAIAAGPDTDVGAVPDNGVHAGAA